MIDKVYIMFSRNHTCSSFLLTVCKYGLFLRSHCPHPCPWSVCHHLLPGPIHELPVVSPSLLFCLRVVPTGLLERPSTRIRWVMLLCTSHLLISLHLAQTKTLALCLQLSPTSSPPTLQPFEVALFSPQSPPSSERHPVHPHPSFPSQPCLARSPPPFACFIYSLTWHHGVIPLSLRVCLLHQKVSSHYVWMNETCTFCPSSKYIFTVLHLGEK